MNGGENAEMRSLCIKNINIYCGGLTDNISSLQDIYILRLWNRDEIVASEALRKNDWNGRTYYSSLSHIQTYYILNTHVSPLHGFKWLLCMDRSCKFMTYYLFARLIFDGCTSYCFSNHHFGLLLEFLSVLKSL